jgi:ADP-heptose:LPS heptosyltransferase
LRILLSRTDRIGDLILSTPAIASVRASFPAAHITMVTSHYNRVVMERSTDVDELLSTDPDKDIAAFGRQLRGYDLAIALAPRTADLRLVGASRARLRVGYTYVRRYLARITSRRYVNRLLISEADPDLCDRDPDCVVRHEVDQLLDLAAAAGATVRETALRVNVNDEDRAAMARVPADPIVLHLGPRWFRTGSTLANTVQLARDLRTLGAPLVLTYAPETDDAIGVFEEAGVADVMLRGLPFYQWAAAFERARCVVTVDTGATHVASAMRRPTVVAFEHRYFRLSSQEWAPYGVPGICIRKPEKSDAASLAQLREDVVDGVRTLMMHA